MGLYLAGTLESNEWSKQKGPHHGTIFAESAKNYFLLNKTWKEPKKQQL